MKVIYDKWDDHKRPEFYSMTLTGGETANWAHKPGAIWPNSQISGNRLFVRVDENGLADILVNGQNADKFITDDAELEAIVGDHLPANLRHLWPTWE